MQLIYIPSSIHLVYWRWILWLISHTRQQASICCIVDGAPELQFKHFISCLLYYCNNHQVKNLVIVPLKYLSVQSLQGVCCFLLFKPDLTKNLLYPNDLYVRLLLEYWAKLMCNEMLTNRLQTVMMNIIPLWT